VRKDAGNLRVLFRYFQPFFQLSEPAICVCMKDDKIKALRLDRRNISESAF
jgi:hypothetical protein